MVSKIDNSSTGALRRLDIARADKADRAGAPARSEDSRPAATSSLLARATALAGAAPEIDQGRIDSIKDAISRGEYRVDPEATARAFIDMELS
ncbi:MAG: flagellar biosynthesis anti-sigma factor FlgM [Perlucidibaca sp.]